MRTAAAVLLSFFFFFDFFLIFFVVFRRCRRQHHVYATLSVRSSIRLWRNYPTNPASWLFHNRATLQYTSRRLTVAPANLRYPTPSLTALFYCAFAACWLLVVGYSALCSAFCVATLLQWHQQSASQAVKQPFGGCHFTTYNDSCLPIYAPSSFIVITLSGAHAPPPYPGNLVL